MASSIVYWRSSFCSLPVLSTGDDDAFLTLEDYKPNFTKKRHTLSTMPSFVAMFLFTLWMASVVVGSAFSVGRCSDILSKQSVQVSFLNRSLLSFSLMRKGLLMH